MIRMSVMIEGLVARGVVTVRGASGVPAGPFYHVLPISGHTSSLVWCGPFRPRIIPRPELGGERGDNERGDKVKKSKPLCSVCGDAPLVILSSV